MATNHTILALENPMDRAVWWVTVQGSQRVKHDCALTHNISGTILREEGTAVKKKKENGKRKEVNIRLVL